MLLAMYRYVVPTVGFGNFIGFPIYIAFLLNQFSGDLLQVESSSSEEASENIGTTPMVAGYI